MLTQVGAVSCGQHWPADQTESGRGAARLPEDQDCQAGQLTRPHLTPADLT